MSALIRIVFQALFAGWALLVGVLVAAREVPQLDVPRFDMRLSTEWSTGHYGEGQATDLMQSHGWRCARPGLRRPFPELWARVASWSRAWAMSG
jgi:hypothetical protein